MNTSALCRYQLRTTDPDAARKFYAEVVGLDLASSDPALAATLLPEMARARGAPSHWLGHMAVPDLDAMMARFAELGCERLGPMHKDVEGLPFAIFRGPSNAVMALCPASPSLTRQSSSIVWHQLHTRDLEHAWAIHSELFGWTRTQTFDVADPVGGHWFFGWDGDGDDTAKSVGSMANTARWPGVHEHWLFYFHVADIEEAFAKVRAHGGRTSSASVITLPNGDRLAPCEDPQGAAFGLATMARRL